jgi:hypothetical protein
MEDSTMIIPLPHLTLSIVLIIRIEYNTGERE